jgi:PAS domain S-box-containing protein
VSESTKALVFNALPLLCVAAAYAVVTGALLPVVWRDRVRAHPLDWAVALVFPGIACAAGIFGALVVHDRSPFGGHVWASFAAACVALAPVLLLLARWGDRAFVVGGIGRSLDAEERMSLRDRELEAVADISNALGRARDRVEVARPLVRHVTSLLGVEFGAVAAVEEGGGRAAGVYAELGGEVASWWAGIQVDLSEPSGIASAVFDAAPLTVFDVASSPLVSPRLAELVGARSGGWIPMIADERVIGVLVVASTGAKRVFSSDELALMQAIASEAALALEHLRSASALSDALGREQAIAEISRRVRAELTPAEVARVAGDELRETLELDRAEVTLGGEPLDGVPVEAHGERVATLRLERAEPFSGGEIFLIETVARETGAALQTAGLLAENQRRLEQQGALLQAAQVVTSELDIETVLRRLVEEVAKLLDADAADCYLLDPERGVLRCAAVHGLEEALVGFEFTPDRGVAGAALRESRPVSAQEYEAVEPSVPHPAYERFARALVAPVVWGGEMRGVLGVGLRDRQRAFSAADAELLEAFASLASLALRNAESYAERSRQARVQRGFYRIAALLGEPLSLDRTYDAAARAAAEALGGDFAAVLAHGPSGLAVVGGHALPDRVRELASPAVLLETGAEGQVLAAVDVSSDDRFDAEWRKAPFASLLAIPVPGDVPGLVLVFFEQERTFSQDDLELAQQVAGAARGALDRSRLFESERTARSLSQQLARTGSLLATELDPVVVLEAVVEEAAALLHADAAALAALDGGELVVTAATGEGAEDALGASAPSTGWISGDVMQSRAPVAYEDVGTDPALSESDVLLALGYRAYLGVPLAAREGALHGVLSVYGRDPRSWREEEIQALVALAASASVALWNAELYQRVAVEREQSVAILANIADGIVAVDRDGEVVLWNHAAEEITGVPTSEALGRTPAQVLQRELESDTGGTNRLVAIPRGGDDVWLSLSEAVMRDPTGAVAGRIFAFRDISAEHAVETMKSDFVSTVSVELRAPLTSIYGFAQTLLRRDVEFGEPERRTFLEFIARESERLTAIVDALLNAARIDTGDLAVSLAPTDVVGVVADVVQGAEASTNGVGHRFVAQVEATTLAAQADPDKLRQVLDQLVSNAIKYSPEGGTVTVSARLLDEAVELAVTDEGIGVLPSERERIFSKFYRAVDAPGRGTGLGLFIAHGLVREMGGRMWVDPHEGQGSRFVFELPLARQVSFPTREA